MLRVEIGARALRELIKNYSAESKAFRKFALENECQNHQQRQHVLAVTASSAPHHFQSTVSDGESDAWL